MFYRQFLDLKQWILWRIEPILDQNGALILDEHGNYKPCKMPYWNYGHNDWLPATAQKGSPYRARHNNPEHWTSYEKALAFHRKVKDSPMGHYL